MSRRNFEAVVHGHYLRCLFMLSACLKHIILYIFFINIGFVILYYFSMMYVTVYIMSFNSNCCIFAAELNYRFTKTISRFLTLFVLQIA